MDRSMPGGDPRPDVPHPAVWFQVLGPLHLFDQGRPVRLGGVKQRAALGFLLLHANQIVGTGDLVRALWPQDAPPTARKVLQNAVSGLRGTLQRGRDAEAVTLLSHPSGYALRVEPNQLDLSCFRRLAERGRAELAAGTPEPAVRSFRAALSLWQGPALADLAETGIGWPELVGLQSARAAALESCFEAELACGRHHEVCAELEFVVDLEPTRERLCAQLMLALYRCGRQVDALNLYRRIRAHLLDGFGLEPGAELQRLERAILNHDPALDLAPPPLAGAPPALSPLAGLSLAGSPPVPSPPAASVGAGQSPRAARIPTPASLPSPAGGPADRAAELNVLRSVLELTLRRRRVHLVTVLGEPRTGKSRLVADLRGMLRDRPDAVSCLIGRTPDDGRDPGTAVLAEIVARYAGIRDTDPPRLAEQRLTAVLHRLVGPGEAATWLLSHLRPLLPGVSGGGDRNGCGTAGGRVGDSERFAAGRYLLERVAAERPLVVVVEDLHRADEALLEFLDGLVRTAQPVPLLVVATARLDFARRRTDWGGGGLSATTVVLEPYAPTRAGRRRPRADRRFLPYGVTAPGHRRDRTRDVSHVSDPRAPDTYSPPLQQTGQYSESDDGQLRRQATPAEEQ